MVVRNTNTDSFQADVLGSDQPVLVDFWSASCAPCRMMLPSLEAVSNEQDAVAVVKVNIEENPNLAATYEINNLPTLLLFVGGNVVKRMTGAKTKAALLSEIGEFLQ